MSNYTISSIYMNHTFSLQQISRTSNLDANLISRQYKLKLKADFIRIKYENPRMKQSERANQISYTSSALQRYRNEINMLSPYSIQPNITNIRTKKVSNTNLNNNLHRELDVKRPQMTSQYLKTTQTNTKSVEKNKNVLKVGSVHENIESNEHYLDEILDNIDI